MTRSLAIEITREKEHGLIKKAAKQKKKILQLNLLTYENNALTAQGSHRSSNVTVESIDQQPVEDTEDSLNATSTSEKAAEPVHTSFKRKESLEKFQEDIVHIFDDVLKTKNLKGKQRKFAYISSERVISYNVTNLNFK